MCNVQSKLAAGSAGKSHHLGDCAEHDGWREYLLHWRGHPGKVVHLGDRFSSWLATGMSFHFPILSHYPPSQGMPSSRNPWIKFVYVGIPHPSSCNTLASQQVQAKTKFKQEPVNKDSANSAPSLALRLHLKHSEEWDRGKPYVVLMLLVLVWNWDKATMKLNATVNLYYFYIYQSKAWIYAADLCFWGRTIRSISEYTSYRKEILSFLFPHF